jgi:hypothetical protein
MDTNTCPCGAPGTEVCYRPGTSDEKWFCGKREHGPQVRELAASGWLSQSAVVAASPMGLLIRRKFQAA